MDKQNKIIITVAIVVIVVIAIFAIFKSAGGLNGGNQVNSTTLSNFFEGYQTLEKLAEISSCPLTPDKDTFAKCLTSKGLTMFGAEWCPHCLEEKALFGDSFKYINYVECPQNTDLCLAKGIQSYPTWILDIDTSSTTTLPIK
jgi:thiol-disulfide isomerase/thioredoxin